MADSQSSFRLKRKDSLLKRKNIAKIVVEEWSKKEAVAKQHPTWGVLHPASDVVFAWECLMLLILISLVVIIPLDVCFEIESELPEPIAIIFLFIDAVFIVDIVLSFRTGFIIPGTNDLVMNPRPIAVRYLRSWFVFDFITSLPTSLISGLFHATFKVLKAVKIIRLLKLLRLLKVAGKMKKLRDRDHWGLRIGKVGQFGFVVFLIAHLSACLWMFSSMWTKNEDGSLHSDSWVVRNDLEELPKDQLYLFCLYWAFTTLSTVGYGDLTPFTKIEILTSLSVMIIGSGIFGIIIGNIASTMTHESYQSALIKEKMKSVAAYMDFRQLPLDLQQKVFLHYEYSWRQTKVYDEENILSELPPSLEREVSLAIHKETIQKVSFLRDLGSDIVPIVLRKLQPIIVPPNENVVTEGTMGREMYMCMKGSLQEFKLHAGRIKTIGHGDAFAEYALILEMAIHPVSICSITLCDLYLLSKSDFDGLGREFPHVYQSVKRLGQERFQKQLQHLRLFMQNLKTSMQGESTDNVVEGDRPSAQEKPSSPISDVSEACDYLAPTGYLRVGQTGQSYKQSPHSLESSTGSSCSNSEQFLLRKNERSISISDAIGSAKQKVQTFKSKRKSVKAALNSDRYSSTRFSGGKSSKIKNGRRRTKPSQRFSKQTYIRSLKSYPSSLKKVYAMDEGSDSEEYIRSVVQEIARRMMKAVEVRDRQYHMRTYKHCFIGSDAVTWMLENNEASTMDEAEQKGTLMIKYGLVSNVLDHQKKLKDGYFLYQFHATKILQEQEDSEDSYQNLLREMVVDCLTDPRKDKPQRLRVIPRARIKLWKTRAGMNVNLQKMEQQSITSDTEYQNRSMSADDSSVLSSAPVPDVDALNQLSEKVDRIEGLLSQLVQGEKPNGSGFPPERPSAQSVHSRGMVLLESQSPMHSRTSSITKDKISKKSRRLSRTGCDSSIVSTFFPEEI